MANQITISIRRDNGVETFNINQTTTLLKTLSYIKENVDSTLTFSTGCRSSVCGTCALRVNGKEQLACEYEVQDGDIIEPLQYHTILRDLKVDKNSTKTTLSTSTSWVHNMNQDIGLNSEDEHKSERQTDCILCDSCYSACPVFAINKDFIGPFALTRSYRYASDKREINSKNIIDNIQTNGIWDCTLCGECTIACPKGIDPKMDITMLRGLSIDYGYEDPSFSNLSFGFNPNGGF